MSRDNVTLFIILTFVRKKPVLPPPPPKLADTYILTELLQYIPCAVAHTNIVRNLRDNWLLRNWAWTVFMVTTKELLERKM